MTTTANSNITETTHNLGATPDGQSDAIALQDTAAPAQAGSETANRGKAESELQAAARRHGLTVKDLAARMGVNYSHLCAVANGRRPWTPMLREKVAAVLGEVPGQGTVYRQGGVVHGGESSYVRERARERGMSLKDLAVVVGVSYGYMTQAARGHRNFSPQVQARVEAVLEGPVRVETAQPPTVDPSVLWERMDAHGYSQNETARLAGISSAHLSQIMNGQRTPSGRVLRKLHEVLFRPTAAELVVPAEVKVMAWKKDERQGVVIRGAGGPEAGRNPGGGTVRIGGRVPWGAEVQYAYRAGYDSRGRVSVTHLVDERGYGVMLKRQEQNGV